MEFTINFDEYQCSTTQSSELEIAVRESIAPYWRQLGMLDKQLANPTLLQLPDYDNLSADQKVDLYKSILDLPSFFILSLVDGRGGWNLSNAHKNDQPQNLQLRNNYHGTQIPFSIFCLPWLGKEGIDPLKALDLAWVSPAGSTTTNPAYVIHQKQVEKFRTVLLKDILNGLESIANTQKLERLYEIFEQTNRYILQKMLHLHIGPWENLENTKLISALCNTGTEGNLFIAMSALGMFGSHTPIWVQEAKVDAGSTSPNTAIGKLGNEHWAGIELPEGRLKGFENFHLCEVSMRDESGNNRSIDELNNELDENFARARDANGVFIAKLIYGSKAGDILGDLRHMLEMKEAYPKHFKIAVDNCQCRGDFRKYLVEVLLKMGKLEGTLENHIDSVNIMDYIDFYVTSESKKHAGPAFEGTFFGNESAKEGFLEGLKILANLVENGEHHPLSEVIHSNEIGLEHTIVDKVFPKDALLNIPLTFRFLAALFIQDQKQAVSAEVWKSIEMKLNNKIEACSKGFDYLWLEPLTKDKVDASLRLINLLIPPVDASNGYSKRQMPDKDTAKVIHHLLSVPLPTAYDSNGHPTDPMDRPFLIGQPIDKKKDSAWLRIATDDMAVYFVYHVSQKYGYSIDQVVDYLGNNLYKPLFWKLGQIAVNPSLFTIINGIPKRNNNGANGSNGHKS